MLQVVTDPARPISGAVSEGHATTQDALIKLLPIGPF
jgi:hypothetical protein